MLSGQKGGNFTATVLSKSTAERAAEKAAGTPSRTAGSPGIIIAEKKQQGGGHTYWQGLNQKNI